jgi:hypothetical protein
MRAPFAPATGRLASHSPVGREIALRHIPMHARIRPRSRAGGVPMLDRVEVHVIDMRREIPLVADQMLSDWRPRRETSYPPRGNV